MQALHLIGRAWGPVFLGKGSADPEVVRGQLHESMADAEVFVGNAVESSQELHVLYLRTMDAFGRDYNAVPDAGWWPIKMQYARLSMMAVPLSLEDKPDFPDFIQRMIELREGMGLDQATMAALLGISRAKMSRLEARKTGALLVEELARAKWWADRLGYLGLYQELFDLSAVPEKPRPDHGLQLVSERTS